MAPVTDQPGYWGERTATIDWCEKNYVESYYVAEMWNTLSNAVMILQGLWGMYGVLQNELEKKFMIAYSFILVVGMGSWAFHMTLLYEMQLFDELPMVWGTCFSVHILAGIKLHKTRSQIIPNPRLGVCLALFSILFTLLYLYYPLPILQHSSFGVLIISSYVIQIYLIRQAQCKLCPILFVLSLSCYVLGFSLWNIDKFYCDTLTSLRDSSPAWLVPSTQLHAWWHCLAGHGTFLSILLSSHLHYDYHPRRGQKLEICRCGLSLRWTPASGKLK